MQIERMEKAAVAARANAFRAEAFVEKKIKPLVQKLSAEAVSRLLANRGMAWAACLDENLSEATRRTMTAGFMRRLRQCVEPSQGVSESGSETLSMADVAYGTNLGSEGERVMLTSILCRYFLRKTPTQVWREYEIALDEWGDANRVES